MRRKWLRLWKTKQMQAGAIRYRKRTRMRILRLSMRATPSEPLTSIPTPEAMPMTEMTPPPMDLPLRRRERLYRIIYLLLIPCRLLALILSPILRYLRRSNWECCSAS